MLKACISKKTPVSQYDTYSLKIVVCHRFSEIIFFSNITLCFWIWSSDTHIYDILFTNKRSKRKTKKGFFFFFFLQFQWTSGGMFWSQRGENRIDILCPVPLIDHSMKIGTSQWTLKSQGQGKSLIYTYMKMAWQYIRSFTLIAE